MRVGVCSIMVIGIVSLSGVIMATSNKKLASYQKTRDFTATTEPKGGTHVRQGKQPIFVIHKHAASHLHYDFRIDVDGVLVSWAVPKGIPRNPAVKRLAIQTEDHPYEYASFEGVIPEGNYGAGTVMVWDKGTYRNIKEKDGALVPMDRCVKQGRIEIEMRGKKLKGAYALIRTKLREGQKKQHWLLIKMNDAYARHDDAGFAQDDISATTGRTMAQIAHKNSAVEDDPAYKVGRRTLQVSNLDKVLFPHDGITKGELIDYYKDIAPYMLPYMKNRAVTMHRFPDGIRHEGFYQKDIGDYFPDWIKRAVIPKEGGKNTYVVCNDAATLVYLANQACITPHIWLSRIDKLDYPDRMIFDLDPGKNNDFAVVREAALSLRSLLEECGLQSFVMTTGAHGVHIVVPIDRKTPFDDVRACARSIAEKLVVQDPKKFTLEARVAKRHGRLYVDVTRNAYAQTGVCPYAVRAHQGASVATPLSWDELERGTIVADTYTIKNIFARLKRVGDPWEKMRSCKQSLKKLC
ncbi:MAG: non-homologous end-joining DNA ligase [Candidatus Babeliales bacterium]|jgi:bifunctional non-homologous end joining protein LigD